MSETRTWMKVGRLMLLAGVGAFFHAQISRPEIVPVDVPPTITRRRIPADALWIDARSGAAYTRGHFPGALNLNEQRWEPAAVFDAWRPGRMVVVYCGGGGCQASRSVALRLVAETGWPEIYVFPDGYQPP